MGELAAWAAHSLFEPAAGSDCRGEGLAELVKMKDDETLTATTPASATSTTQDEAAADLASFHDLLWQDTW